MARLIDAVSLYGELLTYKDDKGCPRRIPDNDCDNFSNTIDIRTVRRAIIKSPTVDAVEVVRCRECKFWVKSFMTDFWGCCSKMDERYSEDCESSFDDTTMPDDFCSYGERKEMRTTRPIDADALVADLIYNKDFFPVAVQHAIETTPTLAVGEELRQLRAERDALRKELTKLTKGSYS